MRAGPPTTAPEQSDAGNHIQERHGTAVMVPTNAVCLTVKQFILESVIPMHAGPLR